jgi:hypothetical protein
MFDRLCRNHAAQVKHNQPLVGKPAAVRSSSANQRGRFGMVCLSGNMSCIQHNRYAD